MTQNKIDKDWFFKQLDESGKSLRGLAKHMELDASAVSRMFSGQRKMKMDEANKIALFLGVTVGEVLKHAGVAIDLDGQPTRVILAATIDERGKLNKMVEARPLPQKLIDRAQATLKGHNGQVIAAQVRAHAGPLALLDDAVVLFDHTDGVEPAAIGQMSICRLRSGDQVLARVERARKTGEAIVRFADDKTSEVTLTTATPVIAIIP